MKFKKIALIGMGLLISISSVVNAGEKRPASAQATNIVRQCPAPEKLIYSGRKWVADNDIRWQSDTNYPRLTDKKSIIKFLEARAFTGNGPDGSKANPHLTCIYKINNWDEIITMKPHIDDGRGDKVIIVTTSQSPSWQYIPHPQEKDFGEWRCSKGANDCEFELRLTYFDFPE